MHPQPEPNWGRARNPTQSELHPEDEFDTTVFRTRICAARGLILLDAIDWLTLFNHATNAQGVR